MYSNIQRIVFLICVVVLVCATAAQAELNLNQLTDSDIAKVKALIKKLEPHVLKRDKTRDKAKLTFEELYAPLNEEEKAFLKQFQYLDAKKLNIKIPFREFATGNEDLVMITGQIVKVRDHKKEGTEKDRRELAPQFLPRHVYKKYQELTAAMKKDLGKTLWVESGYRSSAYQLYLFVFYLQNHKYSIRETARFVALPGYSEHGSPRHQAIDFINQDGINGEDNTAEFEALPEYQWLKKNAKKFGFVESYPKNAPVGITYEPWHWRYEK